MTNFLIIKKLHNNLERHFPILVFHKIKIGMSTNHIIQDVFRGVCEINLETMRDWNKTKMSKLSWT